MQYCPHKELAGRANIIVAGTAVNSTTYLVSPFSNEPGLQFQSHLNESADTSVGIALNLQAQSKLLDSSPLVSSNRFSIDTLAGLFVMVDDSKSVSPDILDSLARMALYEHGDDRELAHITFILNSWLHPDRSPLNAQMFEQPAEELATVLFEELLNRLPKIIAKADHLERYWIDEELKLELTERLLTEGTIQVDIDENLDLAVFTIDPLELSAGGRLVIEQDQKEPKIQKEQKIQKIEKIQNERHSNSSNLSRLSNSDYLEWIDQLHPIGLHNRTSCSRILLQAGNRRHFYYRADSLCLAKRQLILPRRDLSELSEKLNLLEDDEGGTLATQWQHDGIDALKPGMWQVGRHESRINPTSFMAILSEFLQI